MLDFRNPVKHHNFSSLDVVLLILEMMYLIKKKKKKRTSTAQDTFMGSLQGPSVGIERPAGFGVTPDPLFFL